MTITKHLESISFPSLSLPDLLELPKNNKWKRQLQSQQYPLTRSSSFISSIDIFHTTHIHPIALLAMKVFAFSILYHLVEEKTSKSIAGFNYSWYITFFELSCAFLLECIERISIVFNQLNTNTANLSIIDEEAQSLLNTDTNHHNHHTNDTPPRMGLCHRLYISSISILSLSNLCSWSYLFLSFNLVFSRGLATIVLQYYDMDYPTYAICRNSKMVFVMFLSVVWLKKSYRCADWILVLLTTVSVLCFRLASHDLWFSANTMGVPLLLLSTFLSAMDNSWKEKVTIGIKGISPNEILFNINLIAISILFIYLTLFSSEFIEATSFLLYNPTAMLWMLLRGISYALWIHFSVVLIAKAGALLNQYVAASRKLFSVILSFVMFSKPFYFMHGIGFLFFVSACLVKIVMAQKQKEVVDMAADTSLAEKLSDTDCDAVDMDVNVNADGDNREDGQINTVQNRKEHKLMALNNNNNDSDVEIEGESEFEERKYNGYKIKNNNFIQNTSRINVFVQ